MKWLIEILLSPVLKIGEKYLDNQRDRERLQAVSDRVAMSEIEQTRRVKLGSILGQIPLFMAEFSASLYLAAVLVDSTVPMAWLTPLELPDWFKPHFHAALVSVLGIAAVNRWVARK